MDKVVIRDFWRAKAKERTTRWTGESILEFDRWLVGPRVAAGARVLDLGSGFGELSRSVIPPDGTLVAVDAEPEMASGFEGDQRFRFVVGDVVTYRPSETVDVVLLFGVVTHLTPTEEEAVYDNIRDCLAPAGLAIVKNQCSDGESFMVDAMSEQLGVRYVGRYPSIDEQRRRLDERFADVETITYPAHLKMHGNSSHVAFVCSGPSGN
jgi:SAM-dependent methyltransferase